MVKCSWHLKINQITIKAPRVKLQHVIATSPQQKHTDTAKDAEEKTHLRE